SKSGAALVLRACSPFVHHRASTAAVTQPIRLVRSSTSSVESSANAALDLFTTGVRHQRGCTGALSSSFAPLCLSVTFWLHSHALPRCSRCRTDSDKRIEGTAISSLVHPP